MCYFGFICAYKGSGVIFAVHLFNENKVCEMREVGVL